MEPMKSRALTLNNKSRSDRRPVSAGGVPVLVAPPANNYFARITDELAGIRAQLDEFAGIRVQLEQVLTEVRALQQTRLPAPSEQLVELCAAIAGVFEARPFTAARVLEASLDDDRDSVRLCQAIIAVIGHKPSVGRLTRVLSRSRGTFGSWRIMLQKPHSRDGRVFTIEHIP